MPCAAGSLSARRAWIEMASSTPAWLNRSVALRKESVDRNQNADVDLIVCQVALRKESVDRNNVDMDYLMGRSVALRKESVDRN